MSHRGGFTFIYHQLKKTWEHCGKKWDGSNSQCESSGSWEITSFLWNLSMLARFMSSVCCTVLAAFWRKLWTADNFSEEWERVSLIGDIRLAVFISFFSNWRMRLNTGKKKAPSIHKLYFLFYCIFIRLLLLLFTFIM